MWNMPNHGPKLAQVLSDEAIELMHLANDAALELGEVSETAAISTQAICNAIFAVAKEVRALRASVDALAEAQAATDSSRDSREGLAESVAIWGSGDK